MNVQITRVSMNYAGGAIESVQVHFNGRDEERTINVNGYIPLTAEEYQGNEGVASLEQLVREEVSKKIMELPGEEEVVAEEPAE